MRRGRAFRALTAGELGGATRGRPLLHGILVVQRRTWSSTKMIKKFGFLAGFVGGGGLDFALRAAIDP